MSKIKKHKKDKKEHTINELEETMHKNQVSSTFKITQKFKLTERQRQFTDLILDENTNIVIARGPAGTAKTYLAVNAALRIISKGEKEGIIYIRSAVESSSHRLGFLPGEEKDKFQAYTVPFMEKIGELLSPPDFKFLVGSNIISFESTCFIRGRTFSDKVVIVDEAQNLTKKELLLLLTRFGHNCKMILIGDDSQSDINSLDFRKMYDQFYMDQDSRSNGITFFEFFSEDVVRSPIIKHIVNVFNKLDAREKYDKERKKEQKQERQLIIEKGPLDYVKVPYYPNYPNTQRDPFEVPSYDLNRVTCEASVGDVHGLFDGVKV